MIPWPFIYTWPPWAFVREVVAFSRSSWLPAYPRLSYKSAMSSSTVADERLHNAKGETIEKINCWRGQDQVVQLTYSKFLVPSFCARNFVLLSVDNVTASMVEKRVMTNYFELVNSDPAGEFASRCCWHSAILNYFLCIARTIVINLMCSVACY